MQPIPNFPSLINRCFATKHMMTASVASYFGTSSKVTDRHYEGWLERRHFTSIAEDPSRLPDYLLASQLSECVDITSDLPVIGSLVDRRVVLLPVQMVAIARLVVDIHEQHKLIEKTEQAFERKAKRSFKTLRALSEDTQDMITETVHQSPQPIKKVVTDLWSLAVNIKTILLDGLLHDTGTGVQGGLVRAVEDGASAISRQVKETVVYGVEGRVDLGLKEIELAMCYAHLYRTFMGDRYALKDALLRLPENLEVLKKKGADYMGKVITYSQQHWAGGGWQGTEDLRLLTPERCNEGVRVYSEAKEKLGNMISSLEVTTNRKVLEADRANFEDDQAYAESHNKKFLIAQSQQSFLTSALVGGVFFWAGQRLVVRPILAAVAA